MGRGRDTASGSDSDSDDRKLPQVEADNSDHNCPKVMVVKMKRDTSEGIEAPAQMWKKQIKLT